MTLPDIALAREGLAHARWKIEWAKQHISGVEGLVNAVINECKTLLRVQPNPNEGTFAVIFGPTQSLPVALPLHIGDAVHALNSAIDYLWSGLARSFSPSLGSKITFPRHGTRQNLVADIRNAEGRYAAVYQAFPQAEGFILDEVRPYDTGDDSSFVRALGNLDNINKHRLLIATPYVTRLAGDVVIHSEDGSAITMAAGLMIQSQGQPLTLGFSSPVQIKDQPKATVDVVLGESGPFERKPVVETLVRLTQEATKVCSGFERTFLA